MQDELRVARRPDPGTVGQYVSCLYVAWIAARWRGQLKQARRTYASLSSPEGAIRHVFGRHGDQAMRVAGCETGYTYSVYAQNGQYLGLFQMGSYARGKYGHSSTALGQARAAYAYFRDSGYGWSPWTCKPY